ncbi:MAG: glycosyltransferase family 2 protein [Candidatus Eremiobacteraeota bacterium]|uniref:Putative Glycosyl transferase, family 2 n=1 Tax=mine drainage metagenome TaxID=410659 RepID=E6Q7J3_9ZZZZ|nr:glycosyltransferase family 2 protein [Candidatus Eremiobacteraeota bacterium]
MSKVDVIVVTWNDRKNISLALDSILALGEVRENADFARIIVADNGSADGTVEYLNETYGERIQIIENGENLGFGAGVNRALAKSNSQYVFLLNPDATLADGALLELVRFMNEHPRCAIAGPKILDVAGNLAESCGEFDSWAGAYLRSSAWGKWPMFKRFANGAKLRSWDYNSERRVDLVIGAAMLLRRSVFNEIGTFDERYFMYHEEIDLAKRVADFGYESWFVPSALATHVGQGSSGGKSVETIKRRSRRLYWLKHHGAFWYYSLSAALVGRYLLYLGLLWALLALFLHRWNPF